MGRKSVLIVDDSAVSRMVLGRALTEEGYSICIARDGHEAMAWVEDNPPADLVITDLHMPHVDGVGLIRHLRNRQDYQCRPIFVLTTGADDADKARVRQAGATGWIVKPFDRTKLVSAIRQVVMH